METIIVVGTVVATTKLIDVLSGAIGKWLEPTHKRQMADADKYRMDVLAEGMRENCDQSMIYKSDDLTIDSSDVVDLPKRACNRLFYQELKKQQNLEAVANKAYKLLENGEKVTDEPVNPDWITRFINSVEDISDEEMQNIWAKILAGEVKKPKSFSLRTLACVKNLTSEEARLFQNMSQFFVNIEGRILIPNEDELLEQHVKYDDILKLEECGVINARSSLRLTAVSMDSDSTLTIKAQTVELLIKSKLDKTGSSIKLSFNQFPLTNIGAELYKVIDKQTNYDFVNKYATLLQKKHRNLNVSVREIDFVQDILSPKEEPKESPIQVEG